MRARSRGVVQVVAVVGEELPEAVVVVPAVFAKECGAGRRVVDASARVRVAQALAEGP